MVLPKYRGNGPDLNGPQVCGSAGCDGTDPPNFLPVDLTSFIVKMMADKAHLEWKTESELNNSHFIVERYMENAEWVAIGQIMGNGTTNEMHFYEYDDYNVNPYESAYYRLVQVDFDGVSKTHFAVKAEALKIQGHQYRILKTNLIIQIIFEDDHEEFTEIMLIDSHGNVLKKESLDRAEKGYSISFNLAEYSTGWYVVGISGTDNFHLEKMIHVK